MAAVPRPAAREEPAIGPVRRETVERLSLWLLAAVGLDLVLTRFVVRLAIFVPKGEPFASISAFLGRIGAATDALVPIVGFLLLGALLLRAGRSGDRVGAAVLAAIAVVGTGGLALVVLPPTTTVVLVLDLLVVAVAGAAAVGAVRRGSVPRIARLGLFSLAAAVALAALGRAVDLASGGAAMAPASTGVTAGTATAAIGQLAFVTGAALVGLAGLAGAGVGGAPRRRLLGLGLVVALATIAFGLAAPATWRALSIWSLGLAGVTGPLVVGLAAGLAVAGLPALHGRAPSAAVGAAIVLLAGNGLAASGLVLAGLLGLVLAACGSFEPVAQAANRGAGAGAGTW